MDNRTNSAESLRQQIQELIKKIESGNDSLPIELGFPKLLTEIDDILGAEILDVKKLERDAFGIFRLVTESYEFEQSDLGKQLLETRTKITDFLQT